MIIASVVSTWAALALFGCGCVKSGDAYVFTELDRENIRSIALYMESLDNRTQRIERKLDAVKRLQEGQLPAPIEGGNE